MAKRQNTYLTSTAESIGTALGHITGRMDAWNKEREAIAAQIQQVIGSAQDVLGQLGTSASDFVATVQKSAKGGRPKGYKMSAATKAKLRAAWKRRKAAAGSEVKKDVKAAKRAVRKMSAEARAKISAAQKKRWAKVKNG